MKLANLHAPLMWHVVHYENKKIISTRPSGSASTSNECLKYSTITRFYRKYNATIKHYMCLHATGNDITVIKHGCAKL